MVAPVVCGSIVQVATRGRHVQVGCKATAASFKRIKQYTRSSEGAKLSSRCLQSQVGGRITLENFSVATGSLSSREIASNAVIQVLYHSTVLNQNLANYPNSYTVKYSTVCCSFKINHI